jgi:hypothetical protein
MDNNKSEPANKKIKFEKEQEVDPIFYFLRDQFPLIFSFLTYEVYVVRSVCKTLKSICDQYLKNLDQLEQRRRLPSSMSPHILTGIIPDFHRLKALLYRTVPPFKYIAIVHFLQAREKKEWPSKLKLNWSFRFNTFDCKYFIFLKKKKLIPIFKKIHK